MARVLSAILVVCACIGLWVACTAAWRTRHVPKPSGVVFDREVGDVGTLQQGSPPAVCNFRFSNQTGRVVQIAEVKTSCGCSVPQFTRGRIPSGASGTVSVTISAEQRRGPFEHAIAVLFAEPAREPVKLRVRGTMLEHVIIKDRILFLGNVAKSNPPSAEIRVVNVSPGQVRLSGVVSKGGAFSCAELPLAIEPGQEKVIRVKTSFDSITSGFFSDEIRLMFDEPKLTQTVHVYGWAYVGVAGPAVQRVNLGFLKRTNACIRQDVPISSIDGQAFGVLGYEVTGLPLDVRYVQETGTLAKLSVELRSSPTLAVGERIGQVMVRTRSAAGEGSIPLTVVAFVE